MLDMVNSKSRILAACVALLATAGAARAQSSPNLQYGQTPTAAQWNSYFSGKVDVNGGTLNNPNISGGAIRSSDVSSSTAVATGSTVSRTLAARFGDIVNARDFGVVADGATSDDVALAAAVARCSAIGGSLWLPPGQIKLTGAATITLKDCGIFGAGFGAPGSSADLQSWGTTILLTSTSVQPFIAQSNWSVTGVNFFWPGQLDGTTVFPPLFTDDTVHDVHIFYLDKSIIINAYDGFKQNGNAGTAVDWSDGHFSSTTTMYAVHDLFSINSSGDSWHFSSPHFTYAPWAYLGQAGFNAAINAAVQHSSIIHVTAGRGLTIFMENAASFAWKYLVKVDSGGIMNDGIIDGGFDGIQTFADTSAGGCMNGTLLTGAGWDAYQVNLSGSPLGNLPAFNYGPDNGSCHGPIVQNVSLSRVNGSIFVSAGQSIYADNVTAPVGQIGDGSEYYVAHVTANTSTQIKINGGRFAGDGTVHTHGVTNDAAVGLFQVTGASFQSFNEAISAATGSSPVQFVGNNVASTFGSASVLTSGSGIFLQSGNSLDKPTAPSVASCGTGCSIAAGSTPTAGFIQIGSTNPTTAATLTLPWAPSFGSCSFTPTNGVYLAIASVSGNAFTIGASGDIHGTQVFYNCAN